MEQLSAFHRNLATAQDIEFHNLAVDWWDGDSLVWRPTVIEGRCPEKRGGDYRYVEISVPQPGFGGQRVAYGVKQVAITDVRPSRLVNERIARYFTTRYALDVIDDLHECVQSTGRQERDQLRGVVADLKRVQKESFESWLTAFTAGASPFDEQITLGNEYRESSDANNLIQHLNDSDGLFAAIARMGTEMDGSPVAFWDEDGRRWRATLMLNPVTDDSVFSYSSRVEIMAPAMPATVHTVCGADLKPIDIADAGFSLCALPVVARDFAKLYQASITSGIGAEAAAAQPILVSLAKMVTGAATEWAEGYDSGIEGEAPHPQIVALPPEYWGFSTEGVPEHQESDFLRDR
jgi:hypothetical protein